MINHIVDVGSKFYELAMNLPDKQVVYCDIETSSLDCRTGKIISLQIYDGSEIYVYDFTKLDNNALVYIVKALSDSKVKCTFHNAKFDITYLYHFTGMWLTNLFDTMNCEVLINAGLGKSLYSLEDLALKYCGTVLNKEIRDSFWKTEVTNVTEEMLEYSAMDVKVLEEISQQQIEVVREYKEEEVLEIEMGVISALAIMEYTGVLLDKEKWLALSSNEDKRKTALAEKLKEKIIEGILKKHQFTNALEFADKLLIREAAKRKKDRIELEKIQDADNVKGWIINNFNLASKQQMKTALNLLGIKVESTNEKVLNKVKNKSIIPTLLEYREAEKRISNYGENFLKYINPLTNRIHTDYFAMGARTGRLSSNNPNLQNIPKAEGYRECFVAEEGFVFGTFDYSQQEFRLVGAISGEPLIVEAYLQGKDMHTATASLITGKKLEDVTKEERSLGKTVNFAVIYGSSEYGLKRNLNISLDLAKDFIFKFFDGYPRLAEFKKQVEEKVVELGYSTTLLGRRRFNPTKPNFQNTWEYMRYIDGIKREGFNLIFQGTAADITKLAMFNLVTRNPFGNMLRMLLQVHDELDFEIHESIVDEASKFIKEQMEEAEQPFLGPIPAAVDIHIDKYWSKQ